MREKAALAALVLVLGFASLVAQQATESVEVEPITCWWRTTAGSVRIGERFSVVLTCSVLQTQAARVLVDESRLDPSVMQLPPFDVLSGARAEDLTTASRRFVQYEYTLRLLGENFFGTDVSLPALPLTYRVESQVAPDQSSESVQGRDLSYALPALSVRVLSLVPNNATDIREARVPTLGEVTRAAFRGTVLRVIGVILLAMGVLLAALVALSRIRQRRIAMPAAGRALPPAVILHVVRRELAAVQQPSRESGWTPDLVGRALAAGRIVAALALGRPVSQSPAEARVGDGQLAIPGRPGVVTFVSAPITAEAFGKGDVVFGELRDGLSRFTTARYGREPVLDATRLDESLEQVIRIVDRLAADHTWRTETTAALKRSLAGLRGRVWAR